MSQFMALGMTHYPMLAGTDEHMAGLLRWTLQDEDIPAEEKDPANWPERMRKEWGADEGRSAAAAHRRELVGHLRRCRAALDDFAPTTWSSGATTSTRISGRTSSLRSASSPTETWRYPPSR